MESSSPSPNHEDSSGVEESQQLAPQRSLDVGAAFRMIRHGVGRDTWQKNLVHMEGLAHRHAVDLGRTNSGGNNAEEGSGCLLYTSPSPRDRG